jgi:hypothetical protein
MLSTLLVMNIDIHSLAEPLFWRIELLTPAMMGLGNNLDITTHGLVLAQQFQNVDILGNMQTGWTDFLQSGKAGTFTIGLVLGYVVRGITR